MYHFDLYEVNSGFITVRVEWSLRLSVQNTIIIKAYLFGQIYLDSLKKKSGFIITV